MNTFQGFSELLTQNNATRLSIHTVTDTIGKPRGASTKFLAMLAAICPLTKSSLAIDVFCFAILDLDVKNPFTMPLLCSMTAIATVEHAVKLVSAKK
jgi:hypothetical protein